ncbi:SAM-dependent methyltransferase [Paraburkholderia hospita]|uniref:SAM-dependent methyltransferase n=1 Tax=Paraburkholderia hospita TaxID=169430 RepID=UPI0002719464|nr:cyclopropane-fatty-acyl-phospholipid synthase family protein [Paraburkholderia hospita]EUC15254.1 Cyclopropane-fatty-acyl-phospholipid synthase [Burkholderia sp. BT03]SKC83927.1 Cyclopropane fatty-acyl-phospholipid synthase [Paraburkholderia hospita]
MTFSRVFYAAGGAPLFARLFLALLDRLRVGHLVLTTPGGQQRVYGDPHAQPGAQLVLHDWRACHAILQAGDIGFAEAYRARWVDTPDIVALARLAIRNEAALPRTVSGSAPARLLYGLRHWLRPNTRRRSQRNVHVHYDLGNPFYALWLDRTMTYSSALFEGDTSRSLEDAQAAKYQRIVDVLQLRAGMRVLEIGCGWGGFALHAARQGIRVHGVTISPAQYEWARERVAQAGLRDLVTIELRDYRDLRGIYDAAVSVEMFEAVGERYWPTFFTVLGRMLKPGAHALVQSITMDDSRFAEYRSSSDFIREYIFPGGMLPGAERFRAAARRAGMACVESQSFGLDYARTLRCWHARFEENLDAVRALGFDDLFIRTWRLYFAYCEAGFVERRTDVRQFVLTVNP